MMKKNRAFKLKKEHRIKAKLIDFVEVLTAPQKVDTAIVLAGGESQPESPWVDNGGVLVEERYDAVKDALEGFVKETVGKRIELSREVHEAIVRLVTPLGGAFRARLASETISRFYSDEHDCLPRMTPELTLVADVISALEWIDRGINDMIEKAKKSEGGAE